MTTLSVALMLEALGYCLPSETTVWPAGGVVPSRPELTLTGDGPTPKVSFRQGERVIPADVRTLGDRRQWVAVPTADLGPGSWTLAGSRFTGKWEVGVPADAAPRWMDGPMSVSAVGFDWACPTGPYVELRAPIASAVVEVTVTPDDGAWTATRRFAPHEGVIALFDSCNPAFPFVADATYRFDVAGVDAAGHRSETKSLQAKLVREVR